MKLDEEIVRAIAILNCCSNETGAQKVTLFFIAQLDIWSCKTRFQPSCQMQFSLLLARPSRIFLLKTTLKATTVEGLCA